MSRPDQHVSDDERYLFDLRGYLVVEDALDPDQLAALNDILDEKLAETGAAESEALSHVLGWGKPFLDLLDNPTIVPYLEELVDPSFRLDHDYVTVLRRGAKSLFLHGGGTPFDSSQYYAFRDGRPWNGLTVVAYNLMAVNPGEGGFACVPGSHKANYPLPEAFRSLEGEVPACVMSVAAPAGSAIVFTEALTHGTLPWLGEAERRTVFFKYSPHPVSWSSQYYDASDYEGVSDRQRAILEPPNSRVPDRHPPAMTRQKKAAPA
jgi:ectoine hydroxylase-related dioxygenase (phytanoyl-CoA dioxygenase family)